MMVMMAGLGWGAHLGPDRHGQDPGGARLHPLHQLPRRLLHRRREVS